MKFPAKALLAGLVASAALWSGAASAQFYDDGYGRRGGYERRDYDRGYDRGYERDQRGQGYGYGRGNAVNRLSIEEQKQALKNHREAQKKAIKRGYTIP